MEMENIPTADEVRAQLRCMLCGKRFLANENPARFLALIVDKTLNQEVISQKIIGIELFGDRYLRRNISDVRITARNLRKVLAAYYAAEGQGDQVIIELPKPPSGGEPRLPAGEAYKPLFSYNRDSDAVKDFKLGMYYCSRGMASDYEKAIHLFKRVRKALPSHTGAAIGIAEALCFATHFEGLFLSYDECHSVLKKVASYLDSVSRGALTYWRLHAVSAYMFWLNGQVDEARRFYENALRLDRASTESFPPYIFYLCTSKSPSDGMRLSKRYLDSHVDQIAAHIFHARMLIVNKEFDTAETVLKSALEMDVGSPSVRITLALLCVHQKRPDDAIKHYELLKLLIDAPAYSYAVKAFWHYARKWPESMKTKWRKRLPLPT
ncbi:MAG TPA: tetratricopeptide repeat protein [Terriglobia bacterium]|nr:tetratricopeptide repeat protein [Terriglobia bacterium]